MADIEHVIEKVAFEQKRNLAEVNITTSSYGDAECS